ncbi:hypothetical protein TanjilG_24252 [Lupinus angustifolius]|uniref:AIG1-type G domain-containing protein n=1 Tax=Lupinus angustifolius TaxID=3871 RepID=A0A1J7H1Y0_LUPAN|nr:hypothetical protein TanjilG_24252 [Lupinus angustifolius]
MGGSSIHDDWELTSSTKEAKTMLLVGRAGNGKSATGNSILGRKVFKSKTSSSCVTNTCEFQSTELSDGQHVNVIDTPGLFDSSVGDELIVKEIVKCFDLAKDGIHAVLLVFSVGSRFTQEEVAILHRLQALFGDKIVNYMILVFTGGDVLEDDGETLDDYLGCECPQLLKEGAINLRDQQRKADSTKECSKGEILDYRKQMLQMQQKYDDQLERITEMVTSKLTEAMTRLEQQLAEERDARCKAEMDAKSAQRKSDEEIQKLREHLRMANEERGGNSCVIL